MTIWITKTKSISLDWYRKYAKENRKLYGKSDPDMRTGMVWSYHTNGAKKGNPRHSCFDCTLELGYLSIGYTNWNYNNKLRLSM